MTALDDRPATASGPTVRSTVRTARGPVIAVAAVAATAALIALLSASGRSGYLDPDAYTPSGSHAVAALLRDGGVRVDRVSTVDAALAVDGPRTTLLVPEPGALTEPELRRLAAHAGQLVVVGADDDQLAALGVPATVSGEAPVQGRDPACDLEPARRAGDVDLGGALYAARQSGGTGCYASSGEPALLALPARRAVLLGSGSLLTNDRLAHRGNAALGLALLGSGDRLAWLVPDPSRAVPADDRPALSSLVPPAVRLAVVQLAVAVVVLALWRARRLGRVVEEPLPVVVRASEAVEGRARLYQAAGARGAAAEALRGGVRDRVARRLGLPPTTGPAPVVATAAARTGRPAAELELLLYGAAPADDAGLVRLAADLRALEDAVRAGGPAPTPTTGGAGS